MKYSIWSPSAPSAASTSARSFPQLPTWEGIHRNLPTLIRLTPPYILTQGKKPFLKVTGFNVELFNILASYLGVCYDLLLPPDGQYGYRLPNGTITGSLGIINRSEADLSSALTLTRERNEYTDISDSLFIDDFVVIYKRPVLEPDLFSFVKPFTLPLWVMVGASVGVTALFTWVILTATHLLHLRTDQPGAVTEAEGAQDGVREEEGLQDQQMVQDEGALMGTAGKSLWWACSILLGQPLPWQPRRIYIMPGLWLLVTLILGNVYRSNLMAMLILPRIRLPFDTMEELAASTIPVVVPEGNGIHQAILHSDARTQLGSLRKQLVVSTDPEQIARDNVAGRTAVAIPRLIALYFLNTFKITLGDCKLYMMSERALGAGPIVMMMPRGSPLRTSINRVIRSLKEMGILDYLMMRSLPYAAYCMLPITVTDASASQSSRALQLADFYGVFALYVTGLVLASIIFVMEAVVGRTRK
ncbi:glutamate receptor ionotropic, delta-2 isoform X2 [Procambarus clarkii]|uniref:glutamate receptor ionotropic, delta-2 isoform X2 n=1 Tax=Procambarus clarkii TaxID=6728 RepID=UPI00374247F9